jgi:hypothetical protein
MKYSIALCMLAAASATAAQTHTMSGYIYDSPSSQILAGAVVYLPAAGISASANSNGFYTLQIPAGKHAVQVSFLGYNTINEEINIGGNIQKDYYLQPQEQEIEAVTIRADKRANVESAQMSVQKLSSVVIKKIPALMGEVDIIKAIMLLPGVQAAAEGTSAFSVRGGSPDQNLILLDDATLYNASHLMGFFSVFNNDIVHDVKLYKGDIPAAYGGRLSSLLAVTTTDGSEDKIKATGGVGLIFSRLEVEGPIVDNKLMFAIAGRRTYADIFLPLAPDNMAGVRDAILHFYDLNGKLTYKPTLRDRIALSGYWGTDAFGMAKMAGTNFSNGTYTLGWTHIITDKLSFNAEALGSYYGYAMNMGASGMSADWSSYIKDHGMRFDMSYQYGNGGMLRYGISGTFHYVDPCNSTLIMSEQENHIDIQPSRGMESAIYIMNEHKVGERFTLKYGLRAYMFNSLGPMDSMVVYGSDYKEQSTSNIAGGVYHTYWGLEPRVGAVFMLTQNSSIKAAYSRTAQYMHLISNATAGSPLDVWMPSSPNIRPQTANQLSLGYFHNLREDMFELSGEMFFKGLRNVVDFREHARVLGNSRLEGEIRRGIGYTYGVEVMARKNTGALTGWISYTYARSYRKVDEVSDERWYLAPFDRPHNASVVLNYNITRSINVSANWTYATGMPTTYPQGRVILQDGTEYPVYGRRNSGRFEDYHRLDLGITFTLPRHGRYTHELNVSAYNVYNRSNTWYINFDQDAITGMTTATKVYLFGIVPSVTYNFTF